MAMTLDEKRRRAAAAIAAAHLDDMHQGNIDDAAVKKAYVDYSDAAHEALHGGDGLLNKQGATAHADFPNVVLALADTHDKAMAQLDKIQREVVGPALKEQLRSDVERAAKHIHQQGVAEQQLQSVKLQKAAWRDAVANADDPDLHDHHIETGKNTIRQQAKMNNLSDKMLARQIDDFVSGVHADTVETLIPRDPVHAADWYARYGDNLNDIDKQRIEAKLGAVPGDAAAITDANVHPQPIVPEGPVARHLGLLVAGAPRQFSSAATTHPAGLTLASFETTPSAIGDAASGESEPTGQQDDRIPLGSEIDHHPTRPQLDDWVTSLSDDVGALARQTESHDNSARISTGKGDAGGPSYGSYQLAQNRGQVPEFLATEGASWAKELGAAPIYSEQFKSIWQTIARREGQKFKDAENAFARRTKYNPVMLLISEKLHLNLNTRSVAVRGAVTAAANHMGPGGPTRDNGGYGVVRRAIVQTDQSLSRDDPDYDRQLVDNIYGQRKTLLLKMADHLMKKSEDPRVPPDKRAEARAQGVNLRHSAQNVFTDEHNRALGIIATERRRFPQGF
uniref:VgrG-related protein n=1 Tax=Sphingomonas bacterium TaxID=1895847 RepID=UPI002601E2FE|nr:hypothetical protein [Sphingomonas bacterium]